MTTEISHIHWYEQADKCGVISMRFKLNPLEVYVFRAMCERYPRMIKTSTLRGNELYILDFDRYKEYVKTYWDTTLGEHQWLSDEEGDTSDE
jgi:hypothetical protein|tara:strand:- start:2566 stop:2841 length:276 start_codon:yes stop_codon:yes gene_type:complete